LFAELDPSVMTKKEDRSLLPPSPELPDDTPVANVDLGAREKRVLTAYGFKTIGDVRDSPDQALLSLPDMGPGTVAKLREKLGLSSSEGVRPPK
jgi:hypothetical protein